VPLTSRRSQGQWALEGDALREHLADERRRELKLKQKREKKKALAARAAVQRLANPDADGRLQEYTEKQALRKRVKQEHGDTHIHGPTQAVHVSVYADVGIGRGDKPGRDWYEGGRGTGAGGGKNKKPTPVVFGSGIAASAVRGTAPEAAVGGAGHGPRKVRRADYAPPLPRVARVAIGTDDGEELAGYNRHARQPAQKAAALANAGLGVKDGPEAPTGGAATASSRVQGVRAKGRNVRGAGGRGGGESGATAMARDDAMRRIRELEASTRQQESVFQAAMGAVNEQLRSPSTIVAGVKDKETAAGLLEALREIAVAQHNRAVDAEAKQKRLLERLAETRQAAATARAAAERVPGGAEVQQLRVDLAACKKTSSQVRKRFFEPFYTQKRDHFTKTGSGQICTGSDRSAVCSFSFSGWHG
jgi:hypothetical protein